MAKTSTVNHSTPVVHAPLAAYRKADFITSVGYGTGPGARERLGLRGKGPQKIITDLGVFPPDPRTCEFTVTGIFPGVSEETILAVVRIASVIHAIGAVLDAERVAEPVAV